MTKFRGFTLIELMITIAVVAIIAAIAIPSFNAQVRKSRRSEAMQVLSDARVRQESWRAGHATYGTTGNVAFGTSDFYSFTLATPGGNCANGVTASSANSFRLTATASGAQASDSTCATLVLTNLCGVVSKTSTPAGGTCWQ